MVKYGVGDRFLVDGYTISGPDGPKYIYGLEVATVSRSRSDALDTSSIDATYQLTPINPDSLFISDRDMSLDEEVLDELEKLDDDTDEWSEPDSDRPTIECECSSCLRHGTELILTLKRDPRYLDGNTMDEGDWTCKQCSYTYYDGSVSDIPSELIQEVQRRIAEGEACERTEDWWDAYRAEGRDITSI